MTFRKIRFVFFQNEDDRAEFVRAGIVHAGQTQRLPGSGVDVDRFAHTTRRSRESGFTFLLVARLLWEKGVAEYVEAARRIRAEYPGVRFRIVGFLGVKNPSAVSREEVESWAKEGSVEYVGAVDDIQPIYADADCVVLPSYREGVPRTLLEAASMGLPIVTTNAPGCRDTVEDGITGFLCRSRDADDLVNKLQRVLTLTHDERIRMGSAGRQKMILEFDERRVIGAYLRVVEDVCSK